MDGRWRAAPLLIGGPHVALLCGRAETEAMAAVGKVETCVLVYYTPARKPTHPFRPSSVGNFDQSEILFQMKAK